MKDVFLLLIGYGGYLVAPGYFAATQREHRRLSRLMIATLVAQVVGTLSIAVFARYLAARGSDDGLFAWFLIFPMNCVVLGVIGCRIGWEKIRGGGKNA